MQIKSIRVEGLLDAFDYEIELKLDDVATIIHAPNGYGKTTFLSLINTVFAFEFGTLVNFSFNNITFAFVDESELSVSKEVVLDEDQKDGSEEETCLTFVFTDTEGNQEEQEIKTGNLEINTRYLREHAPWLHRVSPHVWRDRRDGTTLNRAELIEQFGSEISEGSASPNQWLKKLFNNTGVTFVDTKRLEVSSFDEDDEYYPHFRRHSPSQSAVRMNADKMKDIIKGNLDEFLTLSQQLDRKFPHRLLDALREPTSESPQVILDKLEEINEKYSRVVDAGLLDPERIDELPQIEPNDTAMRVLALYIEDQEKKLEVFDNLLAKIEILKSIINSRYLRKSLAVSRDTGYSASSDDGKNLSLDTLSSGEQHELVLFHSLLFEVRKESLVLIDEPEISLHVAWQQQFLSDLKEIFDLLGVHFLIATHSPSIIADRWDLTIDLSGEDEE